MGWALPEVAGEWVRREAGAAAGAELKELTVSLWPVADGVSRARRGALFTMAVILTWRETDQDFDLCNVQGYPAHYSLAAVAAWLGKHLPGAGCVVTIRINDAARVGPVWTDARLASNAGKLAKLDPADMRAKLQSKRALAAKMSAGSDKKMALEASADRMEAAADGIDALRAAIAEGG